MGGAIWSKILIQGNVIVGLAALGVALSAMILSGSLALGSVMLAWILVGGSFSISLLVVSCVWVRFPMLAMSLAVCAFVIKIAVLGLFLVAGPALSYDKVWLACSVLGFIVVWQIAEAAVVIRSQ